MSDDIELAKLIAWRNSLSDEEREKYLEQHWTLVEKLHALAGDPPSANDWEEITKRYRAERHRAAAPRR